MPKKQKQHDPLGLFPEEAFVMEDATLSVQALISDGIGAEPGPELLESVRKLGVLIPLIVRRKWGETYEVLAGRRRMAAALKVGLTTVPCRIIPEEYENPEVVTLQENAVRKPNPASEFRAIQSLMKKGYAENQIAKELGIKAAVVKQRLRLGDLKDELLGLMESGHIAVGVGLEASKLPVHVQEDLLRTYAENGDKLTLDDVKRARKIRLGETTRHVLGSLYAAEERATMSVTTALGHLDAAEELLKAQGLQVDFSTLRAEATALISQT